MTGNSGALHVMAKQSGELALLGAIITRAVDDSRAGDLGAMVWLRGSECLGILAGITPGGDDLQELQQQFHMRLEIYE